MWPNRLLFGEDSAMETGPEAARFSNGPVLVVTDPGMMEAGLLGDEEPDGLGYVIHFAQPGDGRVGRDAVLPVPLGDASHEAEYAGFGRAAFFSCV